MPRGRWKYIHTFSIHLFFAKRCSSEPPTEEIFMENGRLYVSIKLNLKFFVTQSVGSMTFGLFDVREKKYFYQEDLYSHTHTHEREAPLIIHRSATLFFFFSTSTTQ